MATSAGLAPGKVACTEIVGMSTSGSGETGSLKNAMPPATTSPSDKSVVATGRRIKGLERFITNAIEVLGAAASIRRRLDIEAAHCHMVSPHAAPNWGLKIIDFWS